jgi:hypothetical protein
MPQQRLYYDYMNEQLVPYWYVLTFKPGEINWSKSILHITCIAPFEYVEREEFDESLINVSIQLSDLIFNPDVPTRIGINLTKVKKRIETHGLDPQVVLQFVIWTPDINEILSLLPNKREMSLMIS